MTIVKKASEEYFNWLLEEDFFYLDVDNNRVPFDDHLREQLSAMKKKELIGVKEFRDIPANLLLATIDTRFSLSNIDPFKKELERYRELDIKELTGLDIVQFFKLPPDDFDTILELAEKLATEEAIRLKEQAEQLKGLDPNAKNKGKDNDWAI